MNSKIKALRELVPDVLIVVGAACLTYGAAMIYPPAGWIVGGAFTLTAGVLGAQRTGED